jgi:hypothetical protein
MSSASPAGRRRQRPDHPPHHISSIAHLFFEDNADLGGGRERGSGRDLAVAGLDDGRVSAWACAGLVQAARAGVFASEGQGVRLIEDPAVKWSAGSHFGADRSRVPPAERGPEAMASRWVWAGRGATGGWVRWAHFGPVDGRSLARLEALAAAVRVLTETWGLGGRLPGRDGLIICVPGERAPQLGAAYALGRLVQTVAPLRLEVLLLPGGWLPGPGGPGHGGCGPQGEVSRGEVAACRRVVAQVVRSCPVAVTPVPRSGQPGPQMVLQGVAARLTGDPAADFSVDRNS